MSDEFTISVGGTEIDPVLGGLVLVVIGVGIGGFGAYDYQQQSDALGKVAAAVT